MTDLELVQLRTSELMAFRLKSIAAVIQRLCPVICDARSAGFSHRTIHSALIAGGLSITWTNYRIALGRASNAAAHAATGKSQAHIGAAPTTVRAPSVCTSFEAAGPAKPVREAGLTPFISDESEGKGNAGGTSSATRVMDALQQAREVAAKDYSRIGLDRHRQQQRNRPPKDLS